MIWNFFSSVWLAQSKLNKSFEILLGLKSARFAQYLLIPLQLSCSGKIPDAGKNEWPGLDSAVSEYLCLHRALLRKAVHCSLFNHSIIRHPMAFLCYAEVKRHLSYWVCMICGGDGEVLHVSKSCWEALILLEFVQSQNGKKSHGTFWYSGFRVESTPHLVGLVWGPGA